MTVAQMHPFPSPRHLDDDAAYAARKPAAALAAVKGTILAVFATVPEGTIFGEGRCDQGAAWARQCGVYLLAATLGHSISDTARLFRRDRSTVRHAIRTVQRHTDRSPDAAAFVDLLETLTIARLRESLGSIPTEASAHLG